jgi:3',5'-cyclic AMP phosphodiesterase CpdA
VKDRTVLPAAGNHDWNTDGAAGYLGYFGTTAAPQGTTWYSTDLGAWHVVVLDSDCAKVGGCDAGSAQGRWLARDLAASTAHCTLAIWHHPRFSSGQHGNDPTVAPFWDQLHAAGAELVINGHDHDYERFAPQDPAGTVERPGGLREIVVGTGGAELRAFHAQAANSEFRQAGVYGVLRLTLHPFNYDWEFLPVGGDIADSGSTPCH